MYLSLLVLYNSCILILTVIFSFQALVQIRTFQDRCVANKGVIRRYCKRQEIENKERDQYKEAVRTLNTELIAKLTLLKEETRCHEDVEKMNTNLTTELDAICK